MDGLEAVTAIRAFEAENPTRRHKLPIIACTAHTDKTTETNIYAVGMQVSFCGTLKRLVWYFEEGDVVL